MTNFLVTYAVNGIDDRGETYNTIIALVKIVDDPDLVKNHCKDKKVNINKLNIFDYTDHCNYGTHPNQHTNFIALMAEII